MNGNQKIEILYHDDFDSLKQGWDKHNSDTKIVETIDQSVSSEDSMVFRTEFERLPIASSQDLWKTTSSQTALRLISSVQENLVPILVSGEIGYEASMNEWEYVHRFLLCCNRVSINY